MHLPIHVDAEMMPNPKQVEEVHHDAVINVLLESREKAFKKGRQTFQKLKHNRR